jgi:hypothetical protein
MRCGGDYGGPPSRPPGNQLPNVIWRIRHYLVQQDQPLLQYKRDSLPAPVRYCGDPHLNSHELLFRIIGLANPANSSRYLNWQSPNGHVLPSDIPARCQLAV